MVRFSKGNEMSVEVHVYIVIFEIASRMNPGQWNRSCSVYATEEMAARDIKRMAQDDKYRNVDNIVRKREVREWEVES